jgi:hypothetical protein
MAQVAVCSWTNTKHIHTVWAERTVVKLFNLLVHPTIIRLLAFKLALLTTQPPPQGVPLALFPGGRVIGVWSGRFFCICCQRRLWLLGTHTDKITAPILCFTLYWCCFPEGSTKLGSPLAFTTPTAHNDGHAIVLMNSRRYVLCHCCFN